ncbi:hypothetical protein PAAG_11127 [Paracoccidioides lutzii Pb01]|uniref:Uncharacterized protein n=1 Tax=Paracoccidioides lutzii (strain ATCC MYA-826 / Pb01) TaxID=502779 RepID=A0A0A2V7A7_PARBA|nr:hypothetical protein PAAG_11127 [Paracoccidioides lutzii Pb01]KGQ02172.1 hypothetical protein PAAG_11127 [Paracoccidioides lutzii Pb01]
MRPHPAATTCIQQRLRPASGVEKCGTCVLLLIARTVKGHDRALRNMPSHALASSLLDLVLGDRAVWLNDCHVNFSSNIEEVLWMRLRTSLNTTLRVASISVYSPTSHGFGGHNVKSNHRQCPTICGSMKI